jgi:hypothetical protein
MGIYIILATGEFGPTSKRFNASPRSPKNSEAASLARLRGNPLTEARGHGEKFSLGTPTSSSASATLRDDTIKSTGQTRFTTLYPDKP